MTWRRIGVYYGLAVLFGAYFFVFLWDPIGERPDPSRFTAVQSQFLPFARESIQQVELQRDGQVIICQLNGETWQVLQPEQAKVAPDLVKSLLKNLTLERETRIVEQNATDLTLYGLDPPHATVILKGKTEQDLATVFIGGRNPTSTAVYASRAGSPEVVMLGYNARYYEELLFEAATGLTAGTSEMTPEAVSNLPQGTTPSDEAVSFTPPAAELPTDTLPDQPSASPQAVETLAESSPTDSVTQPLSPATPQASEATETSKTEEVSSTDSATPPPSPPDTPPTESSATP